MRYSIFILLFLTLLGVASTAQAQLNVIQTQVNLELIPENPGPNEVIQASINSYATNLNAAKISWLINGKIQKSAIGEKVFNFTSGDVGTKTNLSIKIETVEGEIISKNLSINPSTVDLIWQSKGFVPPFYKGKAMFSHQNELTVIAVPHISGSRSEISPKNLIYTWKQNDSVLDSQSGYGKNVLKIQGSIISRPLKIEVTVTSPQDETTAYSHVEIKPNDPAIIFYKKDPLYGIQFQKALTGDVSINDVSEINIISMPLFFGVTDMKSPDLIYKWSINGNPVNNEASNNSQVFRKKEGTTGKSLISLSIENTNKVLQYSSNGFQLNFDNIQN